MSQKVLIEDLLEYKFLENLQYNPSGTVIAYQAAKSDEKKQAYHRDIWIIENGISKQLTSTIDATIVCWLDDETLLIQRSTEDTEAYTTDLYQICIHGGEAMKYLTLPFAMNALKFVNEKTLIATASIDMHEADVYKMNEADRKSYLEAAKEEKENYQVVDELPYWYNGKHFINGMRNALFVVHLDPMHVERITEPSFDVSEFIVEGNKVIYTGEKRHARESLFNQVYAYDIETNGIETIYSKNDYTDRKSVV